MQKDTAFSVTQVNEYIKMTLESSPVLRDIWVRGEISNFKSNYSSGHLYFSLKDEASAIRAVMFRGYSLRLKFRPESGMKVLLHGKISTYAVSGDYQILVDEMLPDGAGALAIQFEQLKQRLAAEGLFDPARKKPIPSFPRSVGVITSASGAALHDIINVSGRRSPATRIVIYPAYVQGELAARSLAGGIKFFNDRHQVDVIIIGRGGGSAEDLWCFNDENLARVIADSKIPVISAVGHETDFTICDFVADMRAPTPSAAAEIAFADVRAIAARLDHLKKRAGIAIQKRMAEIDGRLALLKKSIELHSPTRIVNEKEQMLLRLREKLDILENRILERTEARFQSLLSRLEAGNPLSLLLRGYALVQDEKGTVISHTADLSVGQSVEISLSDGRVRAKITDISHKNTEGE